MSLLAAPMCIVAGFWQIILQPPLVFLYVPIVDQFRIQNRSIVKCAWPFMAAKRAYRPILAFSVHFIGGSIPFLSTNAAFPLDQFAGRKAYAFRRQRVVRVHITAKQLFPMTAFTPAL